MKRIFIFTALFIFAGISAAQSPQGINYQAVARNPDTSPKVNTPISVGIKIKDALGTDLYAETHNPTSNKLGLFNLAIGQGNNPSASFSNINWAGGSKLLEVIIDGVSGGTQPLLSVPYALYAEKTNLQAGNGISVSGNTISNTGDLSNTNEIQALSLNNNQLSLSNGGGTVNLPAPTREIIIIEERTPANSGKGGGSATTNFIRRKLNTVFSNNNSANISLDPNAFTFTLKSGTYMIQATAPAFKCGSHQLLLRNQLNDAAELVGTNAFGQTAPATHDETLSTIYGFLTIPANSTKTYRLEHWVEATNPDSNALGNAHGAGPGTENIYSRVIIDKIQ
jgi:hypothetical protein